MSGVRISLPRPNFDRFMVTVAQLVEPRTVTPVVVGSSPISHPIFPFRMTSKTSPYGAGHVSAHGLACVELTSLPKLQTQYNQIAIITQPKRSHGV